MPASACKKKIAPEFERGALEVLRTKKSLRLLQVSLLAQGRDSWAPEPREVRSIPGGLLVHSRDLAHPARLCACARGIAAASRSDLPMVFTGCRHFRH